MIAATKSSTKKTGLLLLISLGMIVSFLAVPFAEAQRTLEKRFPDYFLSGTLEEDSPFKFNFNLAPGANISDNLTLVNNEKVAKEYTLAAVDSEINNQQNIVFKSVSGNNPNLGQWIVFEKKVVVVPPESHVTIPFTITIPTYTFPGTYYGGISITKNPTVNSESGAAGETGQAQPTFSVKVMTRHIVSLTVNVSGEAEKKYQTGNFSYDQKNNRFIFELNNTGNILLSFKGKIDNNFSGQFESFSDSVNINDFKLLPGSKITQEIKYRPLPLFGTLNSTLTGEVSFFNGITNQYEYLGKVNLTTSSVLFNWTLIIIILSAILLIVLVLGTAAFLHKKYLRECASYTVSEKETLESIAQKYNMSWKKLARINRIKAPYSLTAKQKILVHEKKSK